MVFALFCHLCVHNCVSLSFLALRWFFTAFSSSTAVLFGSVGCKHTNRVAFISSCSVLTQPKQNKIYTQYASTGPGAIGGKPGSEKYMCVRCVCELYCALLLYIGLCLYVNMHVNEATFASLSAVVCVWITFSKRGVFLSHSLFQCMSWYQFIDTNDGQGM